MNGVQTRLKCKPNVKRCKRFVFAAHSPLLHPNTLKTKAIIHFQTDHILTRFVFPPLFRRPEDFRKIYGLTEEQYRTLQPYIRITETPVLQDTSRILVVQATAPYDTLMKYPPGTIIDLNQADTTELKKIPGIGSRIARSIVNRRRLLGGFYQIEQLGEIRLKAEKLRSWFSVDAGKIHRININKASVERMMHHPYISYYQAKVIAEYRKKKGKVRDLKQLMLYEEFTPADFERMAPYVCYD